MARTVKDVRLDSRAARERLAPCIPRRRVTRQRADTLRAPMPCHRTLGAPPQSRVALVGAGRDLVGRAGSWRWKAGTSPDAD